MSAKEKGKKGVLLPKENAEEAAVVRGIEVLGIEVLFALRLAGIRSNFS
jgi:predicted ATPase with chaperone activity